MSPASSVSSLTLKPGARRPVSKLPPVPHILTAAGWVVFGLVILALRIWLHHAIKPHFAFWPLLSPICIAAAAGVLLRAPWARIVISVLAIAGGLFMGAISLAAFYPAELFWWPGALFVGLCAWTLFFAIRIWPDHRSPSIPAA